MLFGANNRVPEHIKGTLTSEFKMFMCVFQCILNGEFTNVRFKLLDAFKSFRYRIHKKPEKSAYYNVNLIWAYGQGLDVVFYKLFHA